MKKSWRHAYSKLAVTATGDSMVADFVAAMTNLTTAETAKYVAKKSEMDTISSIEAISSGAYSSPQDLPVQSQENLVKSSLDAHIKKVQADQISNFTSAQITQMESDAKQKYCGRRAVITVLDAVSSPLESYWFDNKTGEYTVANIKSTRIKGTIDDLSLYENRIILTPTFSSRVLLPKRKYLIVYVINPQTFLPFVKIALI